MPGPFDLAAQAPYAQGGLLDPTQLQPGPGIGKLAPASSLLTPPPGVAPDTQVLTGPGYDQPYKSGFVPASEILAQQQVQQGYGVPGLPGSQGLPGAAGVGAITPAEDERRRQGAWVNQQMNQQRSAAMQSAGAKDRG